MVRKLTNPPSLPILIGLGMIDCIVKWRKETISETFWCSEIIWSAGKVTRLATHKLVDQKKWKERTTNVIFEPIRLNDFKSSHHGHRLVASWASHSSLQRKGKKVGDGCQRERGQNFLRLIITGWLVIAEVESSAYKLACSLFFANIAMVRNLNTLTLQHILSLTQG